MVGMIRGLDVSWFQPTDIDWGAMWADGVRFVVIRVSYGTTPDGSTAEHFARARAAGVLVAPYWFARDAQDPVAQVDAVMAQVNAVGTWDWPLFLDYEQGSQQGANPRQWVDAALARMEQHYPGRRVGIYTGWYLLRDEIGDSPYVRRAVLWIPGGVTYDQQGQRFGSVNALMAAPPPYTTGIWQFGQYGRAGSYTGNLDLNYATPSAVAQLSGRTTAGDAIVNVGRSQVGVKEQPAGSNQVIYWDWWNS